MSAMVLSPAMLGRLPKVAASKASIKRNLFGRSVGAREHSKTFAAEEINKHLIQSSARWEFDFKNETPKKGSRFTWEKVDERCVNASRNISEPAPPSVASRIQASPRVQREENPPAPKSPSAYEQKRITDFMKPRKRRADDAEVVLPVSKMARVNPAAAATSTSFSEINPPSAHTTR